MATRIGLHSSARYDLAVVWMGTFVSLPTSTIYQKIHPLLTIAGYGYHTRWLSRLGTNQSNSLTATNNNNWTAFVDEAGAVFSVLLHRERSRHNAVVSLKTPKIIARKNRHIVPAHTRHSIFHTNNDPLFSKNIVYAVLILTYVLDNY